MPSYAFAPTARAELRKIIARIKADDPGAAERWFTRLQQTCETLAHARQIGRVRDDITPDLYLFPFGDYLILYDHAADGIRIMHIVHGAQDVRRILAAPGGEG